MVAPLAVGSDSLGVIMPTIPFSVSPLLILLPYAVLLGGARYGIEL